MTEEKDTAIGAVNHAYDSNEITEQEAHRLARHKPAWGNNQVRSQFEEDHLHSVNSKRQKITKKIKRFVAPGLKWLVHILVGAYFAYATYHYIDIENNDCDDDPETKSPLCGIQFCNGYGFLVLFLGFIYVGMFYYYIFKPSVGKHIHRKYMRPADKRWMVFSRKPTVSAVTLLIVLAALVVFLYFETRDDRSKLIALVAPVFFVVAGYAFSTARQRIKWRTVVTGITCQFLLGVICIRWEVGRQIFECFGQKVASFLGFTDAGSRFVFGDTIIDDGVFAFAILPVIFFFSFFISILYYLGTMQWVVLKLGWMLQQVMGTTVCESLIAAANIFLGMSESPLLIRPYMKLLTASEIHTVMVSGFATVSGTVLAAYMNFGASPAHLITSSVMAAPAALALSKLYMPETEESKTSSDNIELEKSEDSSLLDAASNGATNATAIVLGIVANIVAFVAFITFLNAVVSWFGYIVGLEDIDFEWIFSKLFIPLAWAMGVPWRDCNIVAKVVATKTIINEFVAYERLGHYIDNGDILARSAGIATFAICGFANPSSLGILIGSLSAIAPQRRDTITRVAFRSFIVGSIVCFISASFAGMLIQEDVESRVYARIFNSTERRNISISSAFLRQ